MDLEKILKECVITFTIKKIINIYKKNYNKLKYLNFLIQMLMIKRFLLT